MKNWVIGLLALFASTVGVAQSADNLVGTWLTEGGKSKVEITKKDGKYYGTIIWLKEPNRDGKPKVDRNNPDDNLKKRPIVGLQILTGFEWDDDEYEDGTIYDPESGKTYSCVITYTNMDTLNVRGYIGFSLMGKTTVWTRVK